MSATELGSEGEDCCCSRRGEAEGDQPAGCGAAMHQRCRGEAAGDAERGGYGDSLTGGRCRHGALPDEVGGSIPASARNSSAKQKNDTASGKAARNEPGGTCQPPACDGGDRSLDAASRAAMSSAASTEKIVRQPARSSPSRRRPARCRPARRCPTVKGDRLVAPFGQHRHERRPCHDHERIADACERAGGKQQQRAVRRGAQAGRDRHHQQAEAEGARMADALGKGAGGKAEQSADERDDGDDRAGGGKREAELGLQRRHQGWDDAELPGGHHADHVDEQETRPRHHAADVREPAHASPRIRYSSGRLTGSRAWRVGRVPRDRPPCRPSTIAELD